MPATRVLKWASKAGNSRGQSGEVYVDSIPIDEALTRTIAWDCAQRPMEVDLARVDENRRGRFSSTRARSTSIGRRSEEETSEIQLSFDFVCRLLLQKKKRTKD